MNFLLVSILSIIEKTLLRPSSSSISRLRGIAEKYYGTSDLRTFQKTNSIYNLDNIKKINDRAANNELPLHGGQ